MVDRRLIYAALGVLALAAVVFAVYPRPRVEEMSLVDFMDALEAIEAVEASGSVLTANVAASKDVGITPSGPVIIEERYLSDPKKLTQLVNRFPREYRILSCGRDGAANGLWQVRYERPAPTEPAPIEVELRRYLAGELDDADLRIEYRESHFGDGARHGTSVVLLGTGELRENMFSSGPGVHMAALDSVRELVELIVELRMWEQYVLAEPPAGTAYTGIYLDVRCGDARSKTWALPRYRRVDDRMSRVAKRLKQLAWVEDHIVVITDEE